MDTRIRLAYLLLFATASSAGLAQSSAQIDLPEATLAAGDSFVVTLTFDAPAPCSAQIEVRFVNKEGKAVDAVGNIEKGQTTAKINTRVPRDFPGGEYISSKEGQIWPCPDYSEIRKISLPERILTVKAVPDANRYPAKAELALTVTQKQFLDTKATQLSALNSRLDTEVENPSLEPPQLGKFLIAIVDSAEGALRETERQYGEKILRPGEKMPAFFADFHAQYQALRVTLTGPGPVPGIAQTSLYAAPMLEDIQLKNRPEGEQLKSARSPDVSAVWQTIKDNIAAYLFVKNNNRITFNAQIKSYPTGARIRYRKMIDNVYSDYSTPTDVPHAEFELATWELKFEKSGCKDAASHIDPYQETEPVNISAELLHCKGK